jgi:hypothetical protein
MSDPCPVCATPAKGLPTAPFDGQAVDCPRCGQYQIAGSLIGTPPLQRLTNAERALVSAWLREQTDFGDLSLLSTYQLESILSRHKPLIREQADRLLLQMIKVDECWREATTFNDPALIARTYSASDREVRFLAGALTEEGFLKHETKGWVVTSKGLMRSEELAGSHVQSAIGFVAMSFATEMRPAYDNDLYPGIDDAGYLPDRVDRAEHVDKIDDAIIASIRRARFVVADFTGHRNGVYFEAGFAQGLGRPVFWTCRKDQMHGLHFDIRQYNCIDWTGLPELRERLARRISAVLGDGPRKRLT